MATYFHGSTSEIPSSADGLQTLYLLNPSYVPYSDTPNMLLLNPNAPANALTLPHAPPHSSEQNLILRSNNPDEISGFHGFPNAAATAPRVHYNLWGSMIDQTTSAGETAAADVSPHMSFRRPNQQGLSLSLSGELGVPGRNQVSGGGDEMRILGNPSSSVSNGISSVILGSKYLKAVQELLDEVVNVGMGIHKDDSTERSTREKMKKANKESTSGIRDGSSGGAELTTAQRQELQMKKSKLVSMLDEVEQRYRQYHHQMQIVISSFEQAAGLGAAKSYTALALKTISKQFRCLKDAIASQMRATSKNLGEDDCLGAKVEGSRLRYVDHHLRQQRALQQLGMIQPNAWRPQRGLPERAVSILRAWLFEHFLHPYPKDSDKVLLAKETGLTRSQVSNWFINARVRLWKPMVEEMYLEETKEQERNGSQDNTSRSNERDKELGPTTNAPQIKAFQSKPENQKTSPTEISNSSMSTSPMGMGGYLQPHSGFHPNKPRSSEMHNSPSSMLSVDMEMKPGDTERGMQRNCKDGYPLITGNDGGYGAFSMEDIGRFNVPDELAPRFHGNGVSLTLGLPHSDNLPLSGAQHGFLSHNINLGTNGTEFCAINTPPSHSGTTSYDNIDIQSRKRFAAQLLPDFVA